MPSVPQTYTISDFIEWNKKAQLKLDPEFQRGSVWTQPAKVFLIDTILNDLPIPQVYFRTKVDAATQTTVREVVDGQQRLRAILDFASGKLQLTNKAPNFKGKRYSDLDIEDQEAFLNYKLPVVQLVNASDADVLEVFARLNSYSVKVTPAELRHAEYSEPVKWAIYDATREWSVLWNEYRLVSLRDSVRLKNTSTMAEMFITVDQGFGDGGEPSITKYYKSKKKEDEKYFLPIRSKVDEIINEIIDQTAEDMLETTFFDAPNFLALFAAIAFLKGYMPKSKVQENVAELNGSGVDWHSGYQKLIKMSQALEDAAGNPHSDGPYAAFINATKSTTHRMSSRRPRFEAIVRALHDEGTEQ